MADMAKTLRARLDTILLMIDGVPELLIASDEADGRYLGSLATVTSDGPRYLLVPVSAKRLSSLRAGHIDLLALLEAPETARHFSGSLDGGHLTLHPEDNVPSDWLPDPGLLLPTLLEPPDESYVAQEAIRTNTAAVVYSFQPEDSPDGHSMEAGRVSAYVRTIRDVVKHAWTRARPHGLSSFSNDPTVHVQAFAMGSFEIRLTAKHKADAAGRTDVGAAMAKVDELVALMSATDEGSAVEVLRSNRGHIIGAFRRLLTLVSEEKSPVKYSWSEPALPRARSSVVWPESARRLVALMDDVDDIASEPVTLTGTFVRVAEDKKTWTIDTADGRVSGYAHEKAGDILSGVVIKTHTYRLHCLEKLVDSVTHGSKTELFLQTLEDAG